MSNKFALSKPQGLDYFLGLPDRKNGSWWGDWFFEKGNKLMITGQAGKGKTLATMCFVGALLDNKPFLDFETRGEHRCMYVNLELKPHSVKRRLAKLSKVFSFKNFWEIHTEGSFPMDITNEEFLNWFIGELKKGDIDVVVFDCLYKMHSKDENEEMAMKPVLNAINRIVKEADIGLILLHHTPKTGNSPKGTQAIAADMDTIINVHTQKRAGKGTTMNVEFTKCRESEIPDPIKGLAINQDTLEVYLDASVAEPRLKLYVHFKESLMRSKTFEELEKEGFKPSAVRQAITRYPDIFKREDDKVIFTPVSC